MGKYRTRRNTYSALFRSFSNPFESGRKNALPVPLSSSDLISPIGPVESSIEDRSPLVDCISTKPPGTQSPSATPEEPHEEDVKERFPNSKIEIVPLPVDTICYSDEKEATSLAPAEHTISKVDTLPLYTPPTAPIESCLGSPEGESEQKVIDKQDEAPNRKGSNKGTKIYHIYHSGKRAESYQVHTTSDREAPLPQVHDPSAPNYVDDPKYRQWKPSLSKRLLSLGLTEKEPSQRSIKRSVMIRNPHLDSRTESAPYFMHRPRIHDRPLNFTLRKGGSKDAPTVCLIRTSPFWYRYRICFDDKLAEDGVIDGRGVINAKYGSKKGKNGTLRGHRFTKRRRYGDTGKEWYKLEKARRKEDKAYEKLEKDLEFSMPITPEEVVELRWRSLFSLQPRKYHFNWSDIDFYWKGTATVADEKLLGFVMGYCHLKLIAVVPATSDSETSKSKKDKKTASREEICLARYICTLADRKAGRLQVYENTTREFVDTHILPGAYHDADDDGSEKEKHNNESFEKKKQDRQAIADKKHSRMHALIFATVNCMIRGESEKRETILEIILAIADGATNA